AAEVETGRLVDGVMRLGHGAGLLGVVTVVLCRGAGPIAKAAGPPRRTSGSLVPDAEEQARPLALRPEETAMPPTVRPELLALLADVKENPADLTPWLVLTDWLEEHGDEADQARAEYCRLCFDKLGKKTYASDWEKGERRRELFRT